MNPYGDGSDGVLNVTSGTHTLDLNRKYQFTTINVASGATLTTSDTTGAVLYLLASESITIAGTIDVSNKVIAGQNNWNTTIDGVPFYTPSVGNGGKGGNANNGGAGGSQGKGFGGGGAGGGEKYSAPFGGGTVSVKGGNGGTGGTPAGVGGASRGPSNNPLNGLNGGTSSGGSGGLLSIGGGSYSGKGGDAYGSNGSNGILSGGNWGHGGGGAGGLAGKAGVNVMLKSLAVSITGQIITAGENGSKGGNGGSAGNGTAGRGSGGGGGGGGNGGTIQIFYTNSFSNTGVRNTMAGLGGAGGTGYATGGAGATGQAGKFLPFRIEPDIDFVPTPYSGGRPLEVSFYASTLGATSWLWDFGDGGTSTDQHPTHTYTTLGSFTVKLEATNPSGTLSETKTNIITTTLKTFSPTITGNFKMGGGILRSLKAYRKITGNFTMGGSIFMTRRGNTAAIQRKTFLYKIYDELGNFQGVLNDVNETGLDYTKEINSPGSSVEIELARNSDSRDTQRENRTVSTGELRTTTTGFTRTVSTLSKPKVGPGSDLNYNNRIDIWIFYGSEVPRTIDDGRERTTTTGETRTVVQGAPNGRIKYSGFISQINTKYGSSETTNITLMSYGYDLDQYIYDDGGKTKVIANGQPASEIVQNAMDRFNAVTLGTYTTYSQTSIDTSSEPVSYTYRVNTYLEVIKKALELAPPDWYWHVGLGDNNIYFKPRSLNPTHKFFLGKHIKDLNLRSGIEDVVNDVVFTGGEVIEGDPNSTLFRRYTRTPAPYTRRGLDRMSDGRVILPGSADLIAQGRLTEANKVQYKTSITILDKAYDIEEIEVGDTVGFANFSNYVDSLVLQVVGLTYSADEVTLQLDSLSPTVSKRLIELRRSQTQTEVQQTPDTPVSV